MQLPEEFQKRMNDMLGDAADAFFAALDKEEQYTGLRIQKSCPKLLELCRGFEKTPWCENGYYADKSKISGNHPYHLAGLIYFQEPSAMAPVSALPIREGDFVLDLCAAPGGKATAAGAELSESGLLVANEIVPKRAKILSENIERCGLSNAIVTNETPENLAARFPAFFDKVIVDAPCSGEGMFRKEPQAVTEWSIAHTKACANRQKLILKDAVKMLREDGYLIYSTCTFAPCENEGVCDWLLSEYPELSLVPITLPGLSDSLGTWTHDLSGAKRIFPHLAKGEGHFLSLFHKSGEKKARNFQTETTGCKEAEGLFRAFESETFLHQREGTFALFGENLYLIPQGLSLKGLRVVRAGLHLGVLRKSRFEPSHALCLATPGDWFIKTVSLPAESEELKSFLRGETIPCGQKGWTAVLADGFPVGWGKASDGILKNHIPKGLRVIGR